MPLEIIDDRVEKIIQGVPTKEEALDRIDHNNLVQIKDAMAKYTTKIAEAIEDAVHNCRFFATVDLDSDFHYLNQDAVTDLLDPFADLGYRIYVTGPTKMDILFD